MADHTIAVIRYGQDVARLSAESVPLDYPDMPWRADPSVGMDAAGTIYAEGRYVYGNVAVRIGETVYHSDEELASDGPEPLPAPYRLEVKFSESLVSATEEGKEEAGFDPQKAQFWVGTLNCNSATPTDKPYEIEVLLYAGEEAKKHTEVSFLVTDNPLCGAGGEEPEEGGGGGGEPPPRP